MVKVTVVGVGVMGSAAAFAIAQEEYVDDLVLIDLLEEYAMGQAMDISQALAHSSDTRVVSGGLNDYTLAEDSDIVVVTSGKPRAPGMTREELLRENEKIITEVAQKLKEHCSGAVIITVANPMDIMNYLIQKITGFQREKVIGMGGRLDSSRFRRVVADELGVPVTSVEGYVVGQHGELQVQLFSRLKVNDKPVGFDNTKRDEIRERIRLSNVEVIERKKATQFAPAICIRDMVRAIATDSKEIIPSSVVLDGEYGLNELSLGVPIVLGKNGAERIFEWKMDEYEKKLFDRAAEKNRTLCSGLSL